MSNKQAGRDRRGLVQMGNEILPLMYEGTDDV
jgi:hypothetical protein